MPFVCMYISAIISECQRFFNFLPIKLRLTIRTAKFLQAFAASENQLCFLFKRLATQRLNDILANYSVDSLFQLTNAVRVQLLGALSLRLYIDLPNEFMYIGAFVSFVVCFACLVLSVLTK